MSGWGSWLASTDSNTKPASTGSPLSPGANFRGVSDAFSQDKLYGPLAPKDLEWTVAGGFATETQTWYSFLADGTFATSQIIHSSVGLWYPQIQITFKLFNPKTGEKVWKSVSVSKFEVGKDKRTCKADQFSINFTTNADGSETYSITANMDTDLQLSWQFTRPVESLGWKLGAGENGGLSYFGTNTAAPDGSVIHRFWPRCTSSGHIISKGQAIDATGQGMFVAAIQGMRPNLVASRWNFANFQSEQHGGVSAIMMEFTTTSDYGRAKKGAVLSEGAPPQREIVTVNVGSVTIGNKLVAVIASTRGGKGGVPEGSASTFKHLNTAVDPETSYNVPQTIQCDWEGGLVDTTTATADLGQKVLASLKIELGEAKSPKGLIEKVDVLAEIPYMIRKFVNYVAGTKPYLYQTYNPATLEVTLPENYKGEASGKLSVEGTVFEEHTFISE